MKPNSKNIKGVLANDPGFVSELRNSAAGQNAYQKYRANYMRMVNPAMQQKRLNVCKAMVEPNRGFRGCIATKVDPQDYQTCTQEYDNPEYQDIELIPYRALKQCVYTKTGNELLAPSKGRINMLPKGLRAYYLQHPDDYTSYIQEHKQELKLLKTVKKNARRRMWQVLLVDLHHRSL